MSAPHRIGRYLIERPLGRGGMGLVYLARDPELDRRVAIKQLQGLGDPGLLERFVREARSSARLRHPSIVTVHEVGSTDQGPYLVMDLVEGETLQARLDRDGPLPAEEAARLVAHLAQAVAHAHDQGVLHRDLKPENVLVTPDGRPVLLDFGLARDRAQEKERLTRTGEVLGTPAFMSPEQASGEVSQVDERTDVYGLAAVLYALLTARRPFEGSTTFEVLNKVLFKEPVPPRQHRPELPEPLEAIVLQGLARERPQRYATAQALADDLQRYLHDEPVLGRPPRRRERRRRALLAAGLPLLFAAAWFASQAETGPSGPDPTLVLEQRVEAVWADLSRACLTLDEVAALTSAQALLDQATRLSEDVPHLVGVQRRQALYAARRALEREREARREARGLLRSSQPVQDAAAWLDRYPDHAAGEWVRSVALSKDWTAQPLSTTPSGVTAAAPLGTQRLVMVREEVVGDVVRVQLLNAPLEGGEPELLDEQVVPVPEGRLPSVRFLVTGRAEADGRGGVVASIGRRLSWLDARGAVKHTESLPATVYDLDVDPTGRRVAAALSDRRVAIVEPGREQVVLSAADYPISAACFVRSGTALAVVLQLPASSNHLGGGPARLYRWELRSDLGGRVFKLPSPDAIRVMCRSPQGAVIAIGNSNGLVSLVDGESLGDGPHDAVHLDPDGLIAGRGVGRFGGRTDQGASGLAFSSDGQRLIVLRHRAEKTELRAWSLAAGWRDPTQVGLYEGPPLYSRLHSFPDGRLVALGKGRGSRDAGDNSLSIAVFPPVGAAVPDPLWLERD